MEQFDFFLKHLKIIGNEPQTIAGYKTYVVPWIEFSQNKEPQSVIHEWLNTRYKREATRKTCWTLIKIYVRWCAKSGLGEDWTQAVKLRFAAPAILPTVTPEEFQKILDIIPKSMIGRRDRAILTTIYYTGARRSAICQMKREDINISDRYIHIITKRKKEMFLPLPRAAAEELNTWLAMSARLKSEWAFPSMHNLKCAIGGQYLTHALPRYVKACGITRRIYVHLLRHTFATEMHSGGVPLETIRDLMGHSQLTTTENYIRRLGNAKRAREASDRVFNKAACWFLAVLNLSAFAFSLD